MKHILAILMIVLPFSEACCQIDGYWQEINTEYLYLTFDTDTCTITTKLYSVNEPDTSGFFISFEHKLKQRNDQIKIIDHYWTSGVFFWRQRDVTKLTFALEGDTLTLSPDYKCSFDSTPADLLGCYQLRFRRVTRKQYEQNTGL